MTPQEVAMEALTRSLLESLRKKRDFVRTCPVPEGETEEGRPGVINTLECLIGIVKLCRNEAMLDRLAGIICSLILMYIQITSQEELNAFYKACGTFLAMMNGVELPTKGGGANVQNN